MSRIILGLSRFWIALVIAVVTIAGGAIIYRFHGVFGSQPGARREMRIENIVSTIPKFVTYEVDGPSRASGMISYVDEKSQPQQVRFGSLPWTYTLVTTPPSVFANVIAQGDAPTLRCTITVNGEVRDEHNETGADATAFCLVKAA